MYIAVILAITCSICVNTSCEPKEDTYEMYEDIKSKLLGTWETKIPMGYIDGTPVSYTTVTINFTKSVFTINDTSYTYEIKQGISNKYYIYTSADDALWFNVDANTLVFTGANSSFGYWMLNKVFNRK